MKKIEITLSDVEYKALACEAMSVEEYLQNYASVRSQKAYDNIVKREIERRLDTGLEIPPSKDDIVMSDDVVMLKDIPEEQDEDDYEVK